MIFKIKSALMQANVTFKTNIAVAVSGGCDSIALLHALKCLSNDIGFQLIAVHINHSIRGDEAERDAEFVLRFCNAMDIECYVHKFDVLKECEISGESVELCARRIRYAAFDKYVKKGYIVATAHTSSDNAETVLFNLTRGTGIKGLCGIPFMREGYIRPMLLCSRCDTENYCREKGIDYVVDSTNLSDDYTRNFIRHNVIPELKKINPELDSSFASMAAQLREIDIMLDGMTDKAYEECRQSNGKFNRVGMLSLERPILSRLIRRIISEVVGLNADYELTNRVCTTVIDGGKTQISGDYFVTATKNNVEFYKSVCSTPFSAELEVGEFFNGYFKLNIILTHIINNQLMQSTIDCDRIIGKAVIRNRMEGDSIKLLGRPTKPVRRLMSEAELPTHVRDCLPLIADDDGVIYIPYVGVAQRVLPDENSKEMIIVTVEGKDNDYGLHW